MVFRFRFMIYTFRPMNLLNLQPDLAPRHSHFLDNIFLYLAQHVCDAIIMLYI